MRLLLIHSDLIEYEVKKGTKYAEKVEESLKHAKMEDALTAFVAVERGDDDDIDATVEESAASIKEVAEKVQTKRIMIYPYAHLSAELSSPEVAIEVMKRVEASLDGYEVIRAPFGWYKSFTIKCKGHPLSELSRSIKPETKVEKQRVEREFYVMGTEGNLVPAAEFITDNRDLADIIIYELGLYVAKGQGIDPPHIKIMKDKELVDYELLSDAGHLRWMPKGKLVRDILIDYAFSLAVDYGAMPVETPVMYDLANRAIYEHADKFGERQYRLKAGTRDMMLRFAACFGMFSMMHDMHLTENDLPLKLYELSTYSFRFEQRGEITGLKRQRAFTMPDMHTACRDVEDAKKYFEEQLKLGFQSGLDLGINYEGIFRSTKEFYEQNEKWVKKLIKDFGKPFVVELLSERTHYWICKCDLAAVDTSRRPIECPTVQIDVESATRFDIKYYEKGVQKRPIILHTSPIGGIERVLCSILETQANERVPMLPVWLSPTQVRVVPVSDKHLAFAQGLVTLLKAAKIRVDLDDRDESTSKKIALAGKDWVPYVVVVGEKEEESGILSVTMRKRREKKEISVEGLIREVLQQADGMPYRPLTLPERISKRPKFI
jgi:threonyl-tRNA synthetase